MTVSPAIGATVHHDGHGAAAAEELAAGLLER